MVTRFLMIILSAFFVRCSYAAPAADGGQVYHRVLRAIPSQLDPALTSSGHELQIIRQMFDQLVTYDKNFALRPMLASDWTIAENGRLYTFNIRKDVLFSDGSRMTVDDVVFSLKRLIEKPGSMYARDLLMIKGARKYRDGSAKSVSGIRSAGGKVEIELEHPNPYLLSFLASAAGAIIKKYPENSGGFAPVGTGPFLWKCATGDSVVLSANKNYYMGPPKLKQIVYHVYSDKAAMYKDFIDGKLDDIAPYNLPVTEPGTRFKRIFTGGIISFVLSVHSLMPPLDKKDVRQAVIMAVDFDKIFKDLQKEYPHLTRSVSYLPKGRPGYLPGFSGLGYDPKKAEQLIRRAGYKSFADLPPITLAYTGNLVYSEELIRGMKKYYDKIGLKFRPERDSTDSGKWHMEMIGADTSYPNGDFLVRDFHSRAQNEYFRTNDKHLDAMIEAVESETLSTKRISMLDAINRYITLSGYIIPLYSGDMFDGTFQKWVEGVRYPNTAFYDLSLCTMYINSDLSKERPVRGCDCGN